MPKLLFAGLLMTLAYVGMRAQAQPEVAWVCTYQPASTSASDPNLLQLIPGLRDVLQINLGPQETISRGSMDCASPAFPAAAHYDNVLVKTESFVAGANIGGRPSLSQVSFSVNAGISDHPEHMFRKYAIQVGGNANLLLVRLGGEGSLNAGPGQVSAAGSLNASPALFSVGGDANIGTLEVINLNAQTRKLARIPRVK